MKKIIALSLLVLVIAVVGCGRKAAPEVDEASAPETKPTKAPVAQASASADTTSEQVTEVSSELDSIDLIDDDLDFSDLDSLERDLDFEI